MIDLRDLRAPVRFDALRKEQLQVVRKLINSDHRIDVANLPTGVGKTLIAWTYARFMGMRAVVLTSTIGLMEQYKRDFTESGIMDVMGMGNYPCKMLEGTASLMGKGMCDSGPCLDGQSCVWKDDGCSYFDAWRKAAEQDIVVTNYAAWFAHGEQSKLTLGPRDLVIADEAHALADEVAGSVGVTFNNKEIDRAAGMATWDMDEWRSWANDQAYTLEEGLRDSEWGGPQARRRARLKLGKMRRLANSSSDWVHGWNEDRKGWSVQLEPISAAPYLEEWVFRGAHKVILLSATVKQPTLQDDLGMDRGGYGFFETGSPFPVKQRPIYGVQLGFKINKDVTANQLEWWVHKMDQIIGPRLDRKGIIHTVSYDRARLVQKLSKHRDLMFVPESHNTREIVAAFRRAGPGAILVSPSVHTGWDFPDDAAEYQIIGKVPYPDTRNGVAKARSDANKAWGTRHAIVTLQQAAGRVNRKESDWAETFILDDSINWLWSSWRSHFSQWFVEAFQKVDRAPVPWAAHRERQVSVESEVGLKIGLDSKAEAVID